MLAGWKTLDIQKQLLDYHPVRRRRRRRPGLPLNRLLDG
jgi:hypothetical protein